jgi:GT2 family glycosyltransferase
MPGSPVTIVVATRNRIERLLATLERLSQLDEASTIIVADNSSSDGTVDRVRARFPSVYLLPLQENLGAYARTVALRHVATPYVAFCDDDAWWTPGSISLGSETLDRHPSIALLNARVVIEPSGMLDAACLRMCAAVRADGLPGHPILFFQAGAAIARVNVFLACGGFDRAFFIGAEEALISIDLLRSGWQMQYLPSMEVRHNPSPAGRDEGARRRWTIRNRLLVAWMRYHPASAWRLTASAAELALSDSEVRAALLRALARAPWAMAHRAPIDSSLQRRIDALCSPQFS